MKKIYKDIVIFDPKNSPFDFSEDILNKIVRQGNEKVIMIILDNIPPVDIGTSINFRLVDSKIIADLILFEEFDKEKQKVEIVGIDTINLKYEVTSYKLYNVGIEPND